MLKCFHAEWRGFSIPPPYAVSSKETKAELKQIEAFHKSLTTPQILRIRHEDETSTMGLFVEVLNQYGFRVTKPTVQKCERLEEELVRIAKHYKEHFKRARPQFSFVKHQRKRVFPPSVSADGYAYPSTRSLVGSVLAMYLSTKFPRATPTLEEYGKQIGWNRVRAGWNHASDYAMGRVLAEHLWKHFDEKGLS